MQPASCDRTAKSCTPCPASSTHAIFWGALLLVCERSPVLGHCIDPAQNLVLVSLGWHHLKGSCSQLWQQRPASTCGIFQFHMHHIHGNIQPLQPYLQIPEKRKGITLWVAGSTGWPHTLLENFSLSPDQRWLQFLCTSSLTQAAFCSWKINRTQITAKIESDAITSYISFG